MELEKSLGAAWQDNGARSRLEAALLRGVSESTRMDSTTIDIKLQGRGFFEQLPCWGMWPQTLNRKS